MCDIANKEVISAQALGPTNLYKICTHTNKQNLYKQTNKQSLYKQTNNYWGWIQSKLYQRFYQYEDNI